jgi:precorrin-6B methylase 1
MTDANGATGRLACVGLGMMLGAHLGPRARDHIATADVVFVAASHPLVEAWVLQMRPDARSLQGHYREGKPRTDTYREMRDAILDAVRMGHRVCAAFYGHPGVFAGVPHAAIAQARVEGLEAVMEPGISAADCLYADLGIDPGRVGCQHFEASQFLFYRRVVDPSAYLVLWQVGIVGDRSYRRFSTGAAHREVLLQRLLEDYPAEHPAIVYEAAVLPIQPPRMQRVALRSLVDTRLEMHSTLVLPPARELQPDLAVLAAIAAADAAGEDVAGSVPIAIPA